MDSINFLHPVFMTNSRFPILIIVGLLGLLGLLATLQYRWLGQISEGERERLQRTVKTDTERFAQDFNREIQNAYFNFQISSEAWVRKDWIEFNKNYKFFRENAAYPDLIENFYFLEFSDGAPLLRYIKEAGEFQPAQWSEKLRKLRQTLNKPQNFQPVNDEFPALFVPIHHLDEKADRILVQSGSKTAPVILPEKFGVLIIELDKNVIQNQIFPDLVKKYFSENESAQYKLAVVDQNDQTVFQTSEVNAADASAKIFSLSPDKFTFLAKREMLPVNEGEKNVVISKVQNNTQEQHLPGKREENFDVQVYSSRQTGEGEKPRVKIFEGKNLNQGIWTLNVQHEAGSLEQFITNTKNKNLAISFGILSLLAVSVVLIIISSQRAKMLAQRQMDFVSSVSHEFRTPLAVIYTAGENLSDGVIRDEDKISNYGNLIKREGKKLSTMVEQILEFAGARSGKRKFDFRPVEVQKVIEAALAECQPLIDEKDFTVEREFAEHLPLISADENALTQAVQNLVINALKYSNGSKWLKISAQNGEKRIKIAVEDCGIGIDRKEIGKVFEPFYRSKQVIDEQIHGNGLGLSLVKQIVEAHGGEIKVESEIGKGSSFTIELPQEN